MSQSYSSLATQGGGRIAYVFFVSGYPWGVTTDQGLVTALNGSTDDIHFVREKMFGKIKWAAYPNTLVDGTMNDYVDMSMWDVVGDVTKFNSAGNYFAKFNYVIAGPNTLSQDCLVSGGYYTVTFRYLVNESEGGNQGDLKVYNGATLLFTSSAVGSWEEQEVSFTATDETLSFGYFSTGSFPHTVYIDWITIDDELSAPAWDVPIFPTLLSEIGEETWSCDEAKGFLDSGGWTVKIQDKQLGHTWDHVDDDDELWGLEGVHRVARLSDSSVHGWGFLDDKLLVHDENDDPPTVISIVEQSYNKLYSRIDGLSPSEWMPVWCEHECIAVNNISEGSWSVDEPFTISIENDGFARGLYKTRPHTHLVGAEKVIAPIVSDVPDSIAGEYAWLYGVPLDESGNLIIGSDGNPIVAVECQGVVSQNISTSGNVTSIKVLPSIDACKLDAATIEWIQKRDYETSLAKYVLCRGENSGTIENSVVPYWQCPHLVLHLCGFVQDNVGEVTKTFEIKPVWLCGPGETVTFNSYDRIMEAVKAEVEKVVHGDHSQHTGGSSTGDFIWPPSVSMLNQAHYIRGDSRTSGESNAITFAYTICISGPLAWVLGLGIPNIIGSGDGGWPVIQNITSMEFGVIKDQYARMLSDFNKFMWDIEFVHRKMDSTRPLANPDEWVYTKGGLRFVPDWDVTPGVRYGMHAPYYYQWDWVNHPLGKWDFVQKSHPGISDVPSEGTTFYLPTDKLWLASGTDSEAYVDTEDVYLGKPFRDTGITRMVGTLDGDIQESSGGDLYIELDSDILEVRDTKPILDGGSIVSMAHLASTPDTPSERPDPFMVSKVMDLEGTNFSDVIRTLFGEIRPNLTLANELRLDHVPFVTTTPELGDYADDFVSMFDWTSMDEIISPIVNGHIYVINTEKLQNVYEIIRQEVLLHGAAMTREWNYSTSQWVIRFRRIEGLNKTNAFLSGRTITEDNLAHGTRNQSHNAQSTLNDIILKCNLGTTTIIGSHTASIHSDRKRITITPSASLFVIDASEPVNLSNAYHGIQSRLTSTLRTLSRPVVSNSATLTRRGFYSAILGRESIITDPTSHRPHTNRLGLEDEACRILSWKRDLGNNKLEIIYTVAGDASYGWAPACRIEAGNFTEHTTYWKGVPNEHDFTSEDQPEDMYFFDCYDLADPSNPQPRPCSCGPYAVKAIPEGNWGWTVYDFTCEIIDDSGTMKLKLTGADTASIDTDKNYVIYFADYDSCEDCQKHYVFFSDQTNTIGSDSNPANRWVG